ncbi:hypothetical protein CLOM_g16406 [Closterium sp. NIES-68]|nr:hypothetical protein CLOM_g16406 [Closterium sp. NIES-68]
MNERGGDANGRGAVAEKTMWVYPLKSKGEVAVAVLKEWMPRAQRECGHKVKVIRSDNGGEFIGADFEGELKRKGIQHQLTVPYNPQQNGVAERAFGCMVVFHVPKEKRGKLEASGRWGVHLGIAKDHKGWLLWDLTTQKLTVSRDVKFLESLYYKEWKQQQQKLPSTPLIVEVDEVQRPSRQEKDEILMLLVYVDDILLFSASTALLDSAEQMLEMQFKCSKMGEVKYYLGMHVERDVGKGVLRLHQRKYCEGLAEKYGLQDGGKPATPLPSGFTVEPCADEEVVGESDRKLFHSMVGSLNYAANHTRPDIAFATSRLASVVSRPSHEQLEAAKRLVRYVSATTSVGLEYSGVRQQLQRGAADVKSGEMLLSCYTDASFNLVKADGTSIGGYVCLLGGGAESWRSKKQNEVGLSSYIFTKRLAEADHWKGMKLAGMSVH